MSDGFKMSFSKIKENDTVAYRIEKKLGVTFIFGEIPIDDFGKLAKGAKNAFLDPVMARIADAQIAFGTEADLAYAKTQLIPIAISNYATKARGMGYSQEEINWLGGGDVGLSSMTIFRKLRGVPSFDQMAHTADAHPRDIWDLKRCIALLDVLPGLKERLPEVAEVSLEWKGLVEDWDALESSFREESASNDFTGNKTRDLLDNALKKYTAHNPRP